MSNKKCPCYECICVPICRHKDFYKMFGKCSLLRAYEPKFHTPSERKESLIIKLENILKPTQWEYLRYEGFDNRYIIGDRNNKYRVICNVPYEEGI